jgi:hypothetical protein
VLVAKLVEQILAANTKLCLQTRGSIVDTRVDDFAVARACLCADGIMALDEYG